MDVKFIALFQLFLCAVHIVSALSWYSSDWYYLPFPNPGTPTGNNIDGSLANVFLTCFCGVLNVVSLVCILFWLFCFLFQKWGVQNQRHIEILTCSCLSFNTHTPLPFHSESQKSWKCNVFLLFCLYEVQNLRS